ncbi:MAG: hypothetical protein A3H93_01715 [Rhodocyclales bacterium RIFCSPLOWO2_02_FULL_63_24]|nr:MAG: hypothetical protein A2040_07245 [Rhodocyclales bacterium GWA2_65_19]OHC68948.1 MAG: hypothetical protein A3H93_01715 [Rhodocyclales bacterium RIFCSPLOWO2_02_FULL_63_24]
MQVFDFDSAIALHKSWKMKFHLAIDAIRSSDFDIQPIGDDARCGLGQWLAANAGELEQFDTAQELLAVHRDFHRRCESIADAIRTGKVVRLNDTAIVEFGVLSEKIEALLLRLKEELHQAG